MLCLMDDDVLLIPHPFHLFILICCFKYLLLAMPLLAPVIFEFSFLFHGSRYSRSTWMLLSSKQVLQVVLLLMEEIPPGM